MAIIYEIGWNRKISGEWGFNSYSDGHKREWNIDNTGYGVIFMPHRIEGFCLEGYVEEWKWRLIDDYIRRLNEEKQHIDYRIEKLERMKKNED
jgi:hypothetical protein